MASSTRMQKGKKRSLKLTLTAANNEQNRTVVHIWHRMVFHRIHIPMQAIYRNGHFKELCSHRDLVLVFDIKSSTFDEVLHHWQVSIRRCPVECCLLCISEIKHVNSHFRSKVLGNANMATLSRQVKSIESTLCMYVQHKQNTIHTDIHRSGIKHNQQVIYNYIRM